MHKNKLQWNHFMDSFYFLLDVFLLVNFKNVIFTFMLLVRLGTSFLKVKIYK